MAEIVTSLSCVHLRSLDINLDLHVSPCQHFCIHYLYLNVCRCHFSFISCMKVTSVPPTALIMLSPTAVHRHS